MHVLSGPLGEFIQLDSRIKPPSFVEAYSSSFAARGEIHLISRVSILVRAGSGEFWRIRLSSAKFRRCQKFLLTLLQLELGRVHWFRQLHFLGRLYWLGDRRHTKVGFERSRCSLV